MKKQEKLELLRSCIGTEKTVRVLGPFDDFYRYYYPLRVGDVLLLGMEENDFQLDGYHVMRISHIKKPEIRDDLCAQINTWNGMAAAVRDPGVDISSWRGVFDSPALRDRFVIIEDEKNRQFAIGSLLKTYARHVLFRRFGSDGEWEDEPIRIPYSTITHVSWGTRYADTWYAYMKEKGLLPER